MVDGGLFIAFEGPEGSGKSTQVRLLGERLSPLGIPLVVTREPGGTPIGEQVRTVLLDRTNCAMLAETEVLLYSAARAQHVGEVLQPALAAGAVVVCDRYVDSTLAYQGAGRGLPLASLAAVQRFATGGLVPDLRVLLDVPAGLGLGRRFAVPGEINRLDVADIAFHERVRGAYLAAAAADPSGWAVIDATGTIAEVADLVVAAVLPWVEQRSKHGARGGRTPTGRA